MNKDANLTEKQRLIGARTVCEGLAISWNEAMIGLNGSREKCLIDIDRKRCSRTLDKPNALWLMIMDNVEKTRKPSIIAKLILNTPGVWENSLPTLSKIAIREKDCTIFYEEIKSEEDLAKTISYLMMGATNKISLLLTN